MKSKLGVIMLLFCVASYFIYQKKDVKKADTKRENLIRGTIVNSINNQPIEGATIAFQGNNPNALSNSEGAFAILAFNDQELVFRHNSYKTIVVVAKDSKIVKMEMIDSGYINKVKEDFPEAGIIIE